MNYLENRLNELQSEYSNLLSSIDKSPFGSFDRIKIWTKIIEIKHKIEEVKLTIKNLN